MYFSNQHCMQFYFITKYFHTATSYANRKKTFCESWMFLSVWTLECDFCMGLS